jgi:hypothetical protein
LAGARDLPEFDNLLDLYWGGPERRITGITARIIGVNTIALLMLMFGVLYMGQYQSSIIKARLETFQSELDLIATALSGAGSENFTANAQTAQDMRKLVGNFSLVSGQRIFVFDQNGKLALDSHEIMGTPSAMPPDTQNYRPSPIQILKNMAAFMLKFTPDRQIFPSYPETHSQNADDYPDAKDALNGDVSLSVWQGTDTRLFLTAAAPLNKKRQAVRLGFARAPRPRHRTGHRQGLAQCAECFCAHIGAHHPALHLSLRCDRPPAQKTRPGRRSRAQRPSQS